MCCTGPLPFANPNLLNPPLLAFSCREALYKDDQSSGRAAEEKSGEEFGSVHELELLEEAVELGDQIYAIALCLPPSITEICASQTTSQQLAQAFATNSVPQEF
ncbi:hypothetical protein C0989_003246 [Termitomyces sp. Mn162]|nr:hypothetical protein C0989_003246 [Termitomyces sp. Mn162]